MQPSALFLYNAGDRAHPNRIYAITAEPIREASAHGYGEYRGHLDFMDLIPDQSDFNNHAGRRLNERIWGGDFTQPLANHTS